jgi:hypothetical protein
MKIICKIFFTACALAAISDLAISAVNPPLEYGPVAQHLLEHVKYQEPAENELAALRSAEPEMLYRELDKDLKKKAFWLNIYNSLAQIELSQSSQLYADRKAFFSRKIFAIAGRSLSLDDIENQMLRRAEPGFLPRFLRPLFMSRLMRRLSVTQLDPRIHFALNCNARSCPPILSYEADKLDTQLEQATLNYLKTSVYYDPATGRLELPELFSWFACDFGGEQGIINLLQKYGGIGQTIRPVFIYKPWDWTPEPGKFQ